jgi:hypothetical protein
LKSNPRHKFALHPILVGLTIVMFENEALHMISREHPLREQHEYYVPGADFPDDISDLLPPSADRWLEHLGRPQLVKLGIHYLPFLNEKPKLPAESSLPISRRQRLR